MHTVSHFINQSFRNEWMTNVGDSETISSTPSWWSKTKYETIHCLTVSCVTPQIFPVCIEMLMMTSSNGNIFRVTGHWCGEFTGPGEFPTQRPVTRSFVVFFDLRLNKRLSKQPCGWWFDTPSWSLWRHCNVTWYSKLAAWWVCNDTKIQHYHFTPCINK